MTLAPRDGGNWVASLPASTAPITVCPSCDSERTTTHHPWINGGFASGWRRCNECGAEFSETPAPPEDKSKAQKGK